MKFLILLLLPAMTLASERYCNDCDETDVDIRVGGDEIDVEVEGDEITIEGDELVIEGDTIDVAPEVNTTISRERQAPNIYLNAGQAERDCGKVIGLSGSNTSGGWALGVPWPRAWAPTCDFWLAANEAQQNGHIWLSYHFQCQIGHIRKAWGDEKCQDVELEAWAELGISEPVGRVVLEEDEYNQLLMSQVKQEDFVKQQQISERQYAHQQDKIELLEKEDAENDTEIERLNREAAALRADGKKRGDREAKRRAAAREALKKDESDGPESDSQ